MPRSKSQQNSVSAPAVISGRWLLTALGLTIPAAILCTWAVFCLLFWQGSWQLLYHPTSAVTRTPSDVGIAFDRVSFATTNAGIAQIQGWWIPAPSARYTALYLHGEAGNIGDTLNALAALHASGMNVLAFDYRGYGQSQFEHPTEARWRQDATRALDYLTGTRHIDSHSMVVVGSGLGANLALQIAAAHPELAGVIIESPLDSPANIIFNDPRARLVPARLLVSDRYDLAAPAAALRTPSLWLVKSANPAIDAAFEKVSAPKTRTADQSPTEPIRSWLAILGK
jgi:pimeloyl-ACP methyl ester carboxylesterase